MEEETTQQQQDTVAPEPQGTPEGVAPEAPVTTPPVETEATPVAPVAPDLGAVPDAETFRKELEAREQQIRALKSTYDRQMYDYQQQVAGQMQGLQTDLYKAQTKDLSQEERILYENQAMKRRLDQMQQRQTQDDTRRQQEQEYRQHMQGWGDYYFSQGIPADVLRTARTPTDMHTVAVNYLRGQVSPAPPQVAPAPGQPTASPRPVPVTSHATAAQPSSAQEDVRALHEQTRLNQKDTTYEGYKALIRLQDEQR